MAQTIKLKRSSTSGATPTTSQLELGEVAINTYDGKMFIKKNDGSDSIVEIGGSSASSEVTKTFTATGSISAGDPVSIKADGTVTKVGASSSTAASTGSTVFFNAPNDANGGLRDSGEIKVAYDGSGYAIATGIDDGDGDKPFFQVFSVSGTTLTAIGSSSTKINDLDVEFPPAIVYDSSISKFIVYGRRVPTGEVGQSHAHYITLDSNGSATVSSGFYSSASHDLASYPANLLSLGDGRQVIYGSDSSNDIFVQLLTTNGTTMTWGDELMITSTGQNREPSAALTTDGKMVIVWRSGNPDDLLGVVVTPPTSPSTTMSAGTVATIADGDPNYLIVAGSVSSGGKVIAYGRPNADNPSGYYRAYVADVSGTGFGSFTMTDQLNAIDKGVIIWDDTKSKFYFFGQSPNTSDKLVRREVTIDGSNGVSFSSEVILDNSNIVEDSRVEGISCGNGLFLIAFYEDQGSESLQSGNLILRQESVSGAGAPVEDYIGINKTAVTDGNTATVVLAGAVTTSGTFTRGSEVFLTDAGAYTNTDNGNRRVGEAITTTDIVLSPLGGIPGNVTTTAAELNILDGATVTTDELNILDGVTATASELNILDGVTATTAELNLLDGVTATTTELNLLDGVTATTTELNYVDGVTSNIQTQLNTKGTVSSLSDLSITATASELNLLDGVTATTTELNYVDGVTSNIQTQLNTKGTVSSLSDLSITATASELNLLDGVTATTTELNLLDGVTATTTELNYVDGVTSNIQTQLNAKAPLASPTFTGTVTAPTLNVSGNLTVSGTTTTLNTATLDVEDKNITLNFGSGDTSASADGAGITIQDAVDASTDATILWDATNDEFDFSHPINASGATFTGNVVLGDTVKIQIGDEPNLEIYHNGSHSFIEDIGGGSLFLKGGPQLKLMNDGETAVLCQKDSHVKLYYNNSEKLSTASTGVAVTGTLTADGLTVDTDTLSVDATNNRVGIGTSSPTEALHISKPSSAVINLQRNDSTTGSAQIKGLGSDGTVDGKFVIYGNTLQFFTDDSSERMRIDSNGRVGIGTTSPARQLVIKNSANAELELYSGDSNSGFVYFRDSGDSNIGALGYDHTNNFMNFRVNDAERMRIDSSGNVGIGDSTPSAKLDVNGAVLLQGGSYSSGTDSGTTVAAAISQGNYIYSDNGNYLRNLIGHTTAGNIQIGQSGTALIGGIDLYTGTSGNNTLTVNGNKIWNAGNDGSGSGLDADTCDGQHLGSTASVQFGVVQLYNPTSSTMRTFVSGSGDSAAKMYWQKGTTTNLMTLDMSGNLVATGNVTAYSDARLKDNIKPISNALTKLDKISGNTYTRNDLEDTDKKYAGVIAQEVEAVLPEAVVEADDGTKAVDYNATIALLIEAVKELKAEVNKLKGEK